MHAETLAYMLHQLPYERKIAQPDPPLRPGARPASGMVRIPAGTATLGLSCTGQSQFGWDNEYETHTVKVDAFSIDPHMVTNQQFLEFLEAGGYQDSSLWNASDWDWKIAGEIHHPAFWKHWGGRWLCRTMFEDVSLPLDWPVYVSHAEASAYARWAGKELPSEAQWHRAAYGTPDGEEQDFPWGSTASGPQHGNFDFHRWDPVPVGSYPQGRSAFGLYDMLGNGWEWTCTPFAPFAGFRPFPFYPGYSADFFDGKHYVMKGGSARTAAGLLRRSFRNWFQPHYPYVYAGFRCITQK
jgi:ergothioneine biosynthesis protein EgtB